MVLRPRALQLRNNRLRDDNGAILPLVLVVSVVLAIVVVAVSTYVATTLRYGQVVEARAGRTAAAHGALDDVFEQLTLRNPICSTAGTDGVDILFPEVINDSAVVVNCRVVGTALPPTEGWAIIVTGEGAPDDGSPIFEFDLGGNPEINGPVFLEVPQRSDFAQPTTIVEGDVWHPDVACAGGAGADIRFQESSLTLADLSFDPSTRGYYCINKSWDELFGTEGPTPSPDIAGLPTNPAYASGTCRVFEPGRYTSLSLGSNNYFKSGVYVFENLGLISLKGKDVTFGHSSRQGFPAIENTPCDAARTSDSTDGATVYVRGDTRFDSRANSGIEISGRRQGGESGPFVALQVLNTSLGYATPLLTADNGAQKEAAFQGLFWAPYNSLVFDTVPSQKAAVLRGGAIVAAFRGGISAAAEGFVIEVDTIDSDVRLLLQSTATDSRSSTTVRAVADYRPSSGELAVVSRRVVD